MLSSNEVPCNRPDSEDDTDVFWLGIVAPGINVGGVDWISDVVFVFRNKVDAAPASNVDVEDVATGVPCFVGGASRHLSPRRTPRLFSDCEDWTGMLLLVLKCDDAGALNTSFGTGVCSKIAGLGELLAIDAFAKIDEVADANDVFLLCRDDDFPPTVAFAFDAELDFVFVAVTPGRALQTRISTRSPGASPRVLPL